MVVLYEDVFENCNDSDACESEHWLGAKGTCDVPTGICVCPDGYSGNDDFAKLNKCIVNESVQRGIWITNVAVASVSLTLCVLGILFLLDRWDIVDIKQKLRRAPSISKSSTRQLATRPSAAPGTKDGDDSETPQLGRSDSAASAKQQRKEAVDRSTPTPSQQQTARKSAAKLRTRQRWSFLALFFMAVYSLGIIVSYSMALAGLQRFDRVWAQDLAFWLAASSIFAALWSMFNVWYQQLPSLRLYSKLFQIDSILIRRPALIQTATYARMVLISVVIFVLAIVLVYWVENTVEMRNLADTVLMITLGCFSLDFLVTALLLGAVLRRLYTILGKLSKEAADQGITSGVEEETFKRALNTIYLMAAAILVLSPGAMTLFFVIALVPEMRDRLYLVFSGVILLGNVAALLVVYFFMTRLAGERKRSDGFAPESAGGSMASDAAML